MHSIEQRLVRWQVQQTQRFGTLRNSGFRKVSFLLALGVAPLVWFWSQTGRAAAVEDSLVRISATLRAPDPYKPWSRQAPVGGIGSGVVIEGQRILTCAHVVSYASQIQVQANRSEEWLTAKVQAMSSEMDLAVLELEAPAFFKTHPPLPRSAHLPAVKDPVLVYGYPKGGEALSTTKGIVSRIEFATYGLSAGGLRVQIDAAVNPGNSGGPALVNDEMVGLAFSMLGGAQNIGYIIPCEEIDLFLKDIADGHYHGKPIMFEHCQGLANSALRAFMRLDKSTEGVLVTRPASDAADYPLKSSDIITRIGDAPVDNEGMVQLEGNLRVFFKYLVQKTVHDGKVPLTIVRDGTRQQIELPVKNDTQFVMPELRNAYPSYFVCGPLVFSSATGQYLAGFMAGQAGGARVAFLLNAHNPMLRRWGDHPAFEGEQLVLLTTIFPHRVSAGYGPWASQVLKSVNGIPIKSLGHLVELLRDSKDAFLVFELDTFAHERMVFRRTELLAATDDVLNDNNIRTQGSADMMKIWSKQNAE